MVIKKLVALNLALAIFGGFGQVEKSLPTLEHEEKVIDHSSQNNSTPHSVGIDEMIKKVGGAKKELSKEMNQLLSEPNQVIEIVVEEKNDYGWYFLDKNSKHEPIIYVDIEMIEHWGIDDMSVGETAKGIFDKEGWELLGFVK